MIPFNALFQSKQFLLHLTLTHEQKYVMCKTEFNSMNLPWEIIDKN